jgi:hypothetical protein
MPLDNVAAATGLVAELQLMAVLAEPLAELGHCKERVGNRADEGDRPIASIFRCRHRDAGFVNIKPDVERLLHSLVLRVSRRRALIRAASRL